MLRIYMNDSGSIYKVIWCIFSVEKKSLRKETKLKSLTLKERCVLIIIIIIIHSVTAKVGQGVPKETLSGIFIQEKPPGAFWIRISSQESFPRWGYHPTSN